MSPMIPVEWSRISIFGVWVSAQILTDVSDQEQATPRKGHIRVLFNSKRMPLIMGCLPGDMDSHSTTRRLSCACPYATGQEGLPPRHGGI
jgi:hypothetical protein